MLRYVPVVLSFNKLFATSRTLTAETFLKQLTANLAIMCYELKRINRYCKIVLGLLQFYRAGQSSHQIAILGWVYLIMTDDNVQVHGMITETPQPHFVSRVENGSVAQVGVVECRARACGRPLHGEQPYCQRLAQTVRQRRHVADYVGN
jgi:hypothetical protein